MFVATVYLLMMCHEKGGWAQQVLLLFTAVWMSSFENLLGNQRSGFQENGVIGLETVPCSSVQCSACMFVFPDATCSRWSWDKKKHLYATFVVESTAPEVVLKWSLQGKYDFGTLILIAGVV